MSSPKKTRAAVACLLTLGVLLSSVLLAGGAMAASSGSKAKIKLGLIELSGQIPYSNYVLKSFQDAAKENDVQLVECDSNLDAQKAINCAAQLKSQGVQGIANFQLDTKRRTARLRGRPEGAGHRDRHPPAAVREGLLRREQHPGRQAGRRRARRVRQEDVELQGRAVVLSLNSPTAGKVIIDRENGELAGVTSECPDVKVTKVARRTRRPTARSSRSPTRSRGCPGSTTAARVSPRTTTRRTARSRPRSRRAGSATSTSARRAAIRPRGRRCAARRRSSTGSPTPAYFPRALRRRRSSRCCSPDRRAEASRRSSTSKPPRHHAANIKRIYPNACK